MKILIETSPEAEIHQVVGQDERNYFVKKPNTNTPVRVAKSKASVLIEPWEAMKAVMEGEGVQVWSKSFDNKWVDVTDSLTFSTLGHYRLTPEPPKPKYIPFTWEDWETFTKKPVRFKSWTLPIFSFIESFSDKKIGLKNGLSVYSVSYTEALESLEFIDGTPFGKEVSQ